MAGIYLHIPFCKQSCHYCNFHFATSLHYKDEMMVAMLKEIELLTTISDEQTATIYFGGGTPSLLSVDEIKNLLEKINEKFSVTADAEITLEANPDDITEEKLIGWKDAGINRLSIGVQSFFEEDLKWMNRAHSAQQAIDSLQLAVQYFSNISIDLIYGTPQLTDEKWKHNVDTVIALNIPHISCYALTVEPKTPLDKMIRLKQSADVNPDKQSKQFLLLMQWLDDAGYEHYEISNFAKPASPAGRPNWRSRHNSSYWCGKNYFGIGPSAHSFNGTERQWNVANNQQYIDSIKKGIIPFEKEILTSTQQLNEYIMTALRTMEGINLNYLQTRFNIEPAEFISKAKKFLENDLVIKNDASIILTREGKLLADGIASDLFY